MTQSLIQHQSYHFCSLARMFTSDQLLKSHARTSGFKDARPGSRTHVRVQGRTSGFKDAHPGSRTQPSTHIRVFGPPQYSYFHAAEKLQKAISGQRSFSTHANDAKNTNSSRVPGKRRRAASQLHLVRPVAVIHP